MSRQAQKERDSTIGLTKGLFYWDGILFVAQRDHGIDASSAPRRYIAGKKRDASQNHNDGGERSRIRWTNTIQETGKRAGQRQSSESTDDHADPEKQHALADDQAQHIAALRA